MVAKTSPEIAKAVGVIMELSEDERTRLLAEAREKYRRDEEARLEYREEKGRQEGERNKAKDIARSLLLEKIPFETVAKATGFSLEEVKTLALNCRLSINELTRSLLTSVDQSRNPSSRISPASMARPRPA